MIKLGHRTMMILAGLIWFAIGIFLLSLGMRFILHALYLDNTSGFCLLKIVSHYVQDTQNAVIILLTMGLLLGFFKGRFVLTKTARKQVDRICTLPNPASIKHLYTKGHYLLIALMICLGISLKYWPISSATRGVVDVAIGSALMNGAMFYFRSAFNYKLIKNKEL